MSSDLRVCVRACVCERQREKEREWEREKTNKCDPDLLKWYTLFSMIPALFFQRWFIVFSFLSSCHPHSYFMSFMKGREIRHVYYRLSRYPHSAQDDRLLTHTALFPEGIFAHRHVFGEVAWRLLCSQVFTPSDNRQSGIIVSASALVALHSSAE